MMLVKRQSIRDGVVREGRFFALIDRNSVVEPAETYEIEVVREITDKRGQKVPIVRLVPHSCRDFYFSPCGKAICRACGKEYAVEGKVVAVDKDTHTLRFEINGIVQDKKMTHEYESKVLAFDEKGEVIELVCKVCGHKEVVERAHTPVGLIDERFEKDIDGGWKCSCGYVHEGETLKTYKELLAKGWKLIKNENKTGMFYVQKRELVFEKEEDRAVILARLPKRRAVMRIWDSDYEFESFVFEIEFIQEPKEDKELFSQLFESLNKLLLYSDRAKRFVYKLL